MEKVIKINADNLVALKNKRSDHSRHFNDLIASLYTCAESYKKLGNESDLSELKEFADKLASERAEFAIILKEGFRDKSRKNHNALNKLKPLLIKLVKGVAQSKGDQAMISTILKNEFNAARKYNTYLYNHIPTIEQLPILLDQKKAVNAAIELFSAGYMLQARGVNILATEVANATY